MKQEVLWIHRYYINIKKGLQYDMNIFNHIEKNWENLEKGGFGAILSVSKRDRLIVGQD